MNRSPSQSPAAANNGAAGPRPAVFLDRDGTVSREAGYINHPERIELLPGSATAIRQLNDRGILALLTTNQAGVGRGYFTEDVLHKIHERLQQQLALKRARLDAIYYAPTHPDAKIERYRRDDNLRKPRTGMIEQACRDFAIDLSRSYVVGDKGTDIEFARNAGVKGVFVLSGYGLGEYEHQRHEWKHQPDHVAEDLREAVSWIIEDLRVAEPAR